ncbi:MAG: hypothetical protein P1U34_07640 [Coxiellaceae bacterium]|nr:hypothetical protein [Coxiellaceae bacterium]
MRLEEVKGVIAEATAVVADRMKGMEKAGSLAGSMMMLFTEFVRKDKNSSPSAIQAYLKQMDGICDKLLNPAGYTNLNEANTDLAKLETMSVTITNFKDTKTTHIDIHHRVRQAFQAVDNALRAKATELLATASASTGSGHGRAPGS